jgi:hypothetical protein
LAQWQRIPTCTPKFFVDEPPAAWIGGLGAMTGETIRA